MTIEDTVAPVGGAGAGAPIWSAATLPWRLAEVAAAGVLAGILMILVWLTPRTDLHVAAVHAAFWIKAAYASAIAGCALIAATQVARGRSSGGVALGLCGVLVLAMLIAGGVQAMTVDRASLLALYRSTGLACLGDILAIAAPMLFFSSLGLSTVDLERPGLVGFAAGLVCGGVADAVFGLHCPFSSFAFIGPWHTAGIALCGGAGLALSVGLRAVFRRDNGSREVAFLPG